MQDGRRAVGVLGLLRQDIAVISDPGLLPLLERSFRTNAARRIDIDNPEDAPWGGGPASGHGPAAASRCRTAGAISVGKGCRGGITWDLWAIRGDHHHRP